MKKLTIFIALLLTVLIVGAPLVVSAAGNPTISVGSAGETKAGAEFAVPVSITGNPGFSGVALMLKYDKSVLELVGFSKDGMFGSNIVENISSDSLAFLSMGDVTGDGTLFSATFKVKDGAKAGNYSIEAGLRENLEKNFVNAATEVVPVKFTAGGVAVAGAAQDGSKENDASGDGKENAGATDGQTNPGGDAESASGETVHKATAADGGSRDIQIRGTTNATREYSLDGGATWKPVPENGIVTTDDDKRISVYGDGEADFYVKDIVPDKTPAAAGADTDDSQTGSRAIVITVIVIAVIAIAIVALVLVRRHLRKK